MYLFLAAVLTLLPVPHPQEKDKEHPLVTAAKESLPDTTKPFTILVRFKVKEGQVPQFEAAVAKAVKETRKEKGNLAYELSRSAKGSSYIFYERWENLAALEAHLKTPHFTSTQAEVDKLIDGATEVHIFVPVSLSAGD